MRFPALPILLALLFADMAQAQEKTITLREAPGRAVVENNCGACHSLDYILMNSPFLVTKTWGAEVNKMIMTFGAKIDPPDAKVIIDYLTANYGSPG